jgi:hypothetical protein
LKALVITPVKDSPDTTMRTIEAVSRSKGDFSYIVFNDFSRKETRSILEENQVKYNYSIIHLEEITNTPSPNYNLVLKIAQKNATENNVPLIIIESDVVIKEDTISELVKLHNRLKNPGLIGAITTDIAGVYNFPYASEKKSKKGISDTKRSLSFCCTLISVKFLREYSFDELSQKKDWFDIFISRQSRKSGFRNYLARRIEVLHLPHSSRPWKQLKYTNPLKYYFRKMVTHRDRI